MWLSLLLLPTAHARPEAPAAFCETYPDVPACVTGATACAIVPTNTMMRKNARQVTVSLREVKNLVICFSMMLELNGLNE